MRESNCFLWKFMWNSCACEVDTVYSGVQIGTADLWPTVTSQARHAGFSSCAEPARDDKARRAGEARPPPPWPHPAASAPAALGLLRACLRPAVGLAIPGPMGWGVDPSTTGRSGHAVVESTVACFEPARAVRPIWTSLIVHLYTGHTKSKIWGNKREKSGVNKMLGQGIG